MTKEIKDLLKNLSAKEREVIVLLFGLDNGIAHPVEMISSLYGVEKEVILQIATETLNKLSVSKEELTELAQKVAQSHPKVKRWKVRKVNLFGHSPKSAKKSLKIFDEMEKMFNESDSKK